MGWGTGRSTRPWKNLSWRLWPFVPDLDPCGSPFIPTTPPDAAPSKSLLRSLIYCSKIWSHEESLLGSLGGSFHLNHGLGLQPLQLNRRSSGRTALDLYHGGFLTHGGWYFSWKWQGDSGLLPRDLGLGLLPAHWRNTLKKPTQIS